MHNTELWDYDPQNLIKIRFIYIRFVSKYLI